MPIDEDMMPSGPEPTATASQTEMAEEKPSSATETATAVIDEAAAAHGFEHQPSSPSETAQPSTHVQPSFEVPATSVAIHSDGSFQVSAEESHKVATPATESPVERPFEAPADLAASEPPVKPPTAIQPPAGAKQTDEDLFEAALSAMDADEGTETSYKKLAKGDRVEATVIQVDRDRVFVDLGTKSEGIVPIGELTDLAIEHPSEHVKVGDKIEVIVLKTESAEGNAIVSKKRADFENTWIRIEEIFASGASINAPVIDRVKGGLVVDVGVRGFVPATHVGNGRLRNIDKYVGQTLDCRILEIDRERRKVVLSNRHAEEQRRAQAKDDLFTNVKPGEILDGTVRRLTDYGAFVDLGGVDGLLHISEMSWMRINHPREMFKEGQKIKIMVLRLDKDHGKISLGHRQVLPDPWNLIKENYKPNQKLTVKISRIVQAGAFVKLPEGAEAFLPLSEMSSRRLKRPQEAVTEEQEVEVLVIDLKPDDRRMVLSMRALGGGPAMPMPSATFADDDRESRRATGGKRGKKSKGGRRQEEEELEDIMGRRSFGSAGGGAGVTIGERLGMLRGFGNREEEEEVGAELHDEPIVEAPLEPSNADAAGSETAQAAVPEATPDAAPEPSTSKANAAKETGVTSPEGSSAPSGPETAEELPEG